MTYGPDYVIKKLNLVELPFEGGYYRETYRSDKSVGVDYDDIENTKSNSLANSEPNNNSRGIRSLFTHIYYLLDGERHSALHKVRSDEVWHFYMGSTVTIYILCDDDDNVDDGVDSGSGKLQQIRLGPDIESGEDLHYVIKGNTWFGAELANKSSYALLGCSVSPGFEFRDFELGKRKELVAKYPKHEWLINKLTDG
ncbi:MAG: cupin domain-containing protein [Thermoproteota archaeon]|nr:cupin domain-containing protein [Thermoproteota archaeon]